MKKNSSQYYFFLIVLFGGKTDILSITYFLRQIFFTVQSFLSVLAGGNLTVVRIITDFK
jgi:hypothetical protein